MNRRRWWLGGLALVALVVLLSPLASTDPDGLERVSQDLGFAASAESAPFELLPGYAVPGLDGPMTTTLAGLVGVALVFGLMWGLGLYLSRRRHRTGDPGAS